MMVNGCCSTVPSLWEATGQDEAKTLKTRAEVLAWGKQRTSQDKVFLPSSSKELHWKDLDVTNSRTSQSSAQNLQSLLVHLESKSEFLQHPSRSSTIWGLDPSTDILPPLSSSPSSAAVTLLLLEHPIHVLPLGLCTCCFFPSGMLFPSDSHLAWFLISFIPRIKCHLLTEAYLDHPIYNLIPFPSPVNLRAFGQFGRDCPLLKPKGQHCSPDPGTITGKSSSGVVQTEFSLVQTLLSLGT